MLRCICNTGVINPSIMRSSFAWIIKFCGVKTRPEGQATGYLDNSLRGAGRVIARAIIGTVISVLAGLFVSARIFLHLFRIAV